MQDRIRFAVDRVLLSKGYTMAGSAAPDFLVGYHATVQSKTNVTTVNDRYGPGYGAGWGHGSVQVYEYDEGLLILDIVDPVGKKLLWRGSASDVVSQSRSVDARQEQLQEAVTKILENFPPRPKK